MSLTNLADIRIDPEFHAYIPDLSDEERGQLEQNIVADGCRDPLVVWGDILIDGHNRFEICTRLGLPFTVIEKDFADREAALDWMDAHQLGRRNLSPSTRKLLLGRRYNRVKDARGGDRGNQHTVAKGQNDPLPESTAARLAKEHGVSEATVKRAGKFAEEVEQNPELKAAVETGKSVAEVMRQLATEAREAEPKPAAPTPDPVDAAAAKQRREIARLSTDGMIDEIIGLRDLVAEMKAKAAALKAERDKLRDQLKDFTGDKDDVIRRLKREIDHKSSEMFRANEKFDAEKRKNYVLSKRVKELEAMPIDMGQP